MVHVLSRTLRTLRLAPSSARSFAGTHTLSLHPVTESSSNSPTCISTPSHLYHSKHFINSFLSQTSAPLHPQALSFDRHPFFAGGGVGYQTGYPFAAISAFCLPVSPLDKPLTDTLSRKSFRYVSYAKRWGVGGGSNSKLNSTEHNRLRRGAVRQANQLLELRVIMEAIEIGVARGPIEIAVAGREGLLQRFQRFCFSREDAIRARGIV